MYASFPYDAGHGSRGIGFWEFIAPLQLGSGAVGHVFKVPPEPVAGFNGPAFTLGANIDTLAAQLGATNATYRESSLSFMTPPDVGNLEAVKRRGGKVMVYHGVSDPIFSWHDTVAWWNAVQARDGADPSDFARIYPVPGMDHCGGGPGLRRARPCCARRVHNCVQRPPAGSSAVRWLDSSRRPNPPSWLWPCSPVPRAEP